jgi:hypothetical protein
MARTVRRKEMKMAIINGRQEQVKHCPVCGKLTVKKGHGKGLVKKYRLFNPEDGTLHRHKRPTPMWKLL